MKFFCVRTAQNTNNSRFNDMLKIVLQTPPQLRTDDDHSKVFAYFNQDIYLNTFERTRGVPKMMLAISVLQGLKVTSPHQIMEIIDSIQYLVVFEGSFKTDNQMFKEKSYILQKQLAKITDITIDRDGCFIVYLSKQNYHKLLQFKLNQIKVILESLKQFALFSQISHIHLLYLAANTVPETYRFRQFIYKFGQESTYVYCIIDGPFQMIRRFKKQKANYQSSITSIEGGQTFGQDCVFLKCNRQSEIRSLSCDNFVYKMPSQCLVWVYNQYPKLRQQLVETIKQRRAYIQKRAAEIADTHTNPLNAKLKNASFHEGNSVIFPKLKQSIMNREKSQIKSPNKQKTHQEVGMELFAKAFNLNQSQVMNNLEKHLKSNTKENILRSLGASYLVQKLNNRQGESKSFSNKSNYSTSKHESEVKDSFFQFPLVEQSNKPRKQLKLKKKYQRFKIKHRFEDQSIESGLNQSAEMTLKKIFSLNY